MAISRVVNEILNVENCRELEIPVKGHSRLLKVVPFDRLGMVSYERSTVTMGLSRTIFEIDGDFSRKLQIFPTPVYSPWN